MEFSWDQLFEILGPLMLGDTSEWDLYYALSFALAARSDKAPKDPNAVYNATAGAELESDDFYKAIYQFMALDYLEPSTLIKQGLRFKAPHHECPVITQTNSVGSGRNHRRFCGLIP